MKLFYNIIFLFCLSNIYAQNINFLTNNDSLLLWVNADSISELNGNIDSVYDKSGNNNHFFQNNNLFKPKFYNNGQNNFILFENDFLNGTTLEGINEDSYTVIIILNGYEISSPGRGILSINNFNPDYALEKINGGLKF